LSFDKNLLFFDILLLFRGNMQIEKKERGRFCVNRLVYSVCIPEIEVLFTLKTSRFINDNGF